MFQQLLDIFAFLLQLSTDKIVKVLNILEKNIQDGSKLSTLLNHVSFKLHHFTPLFSTSFSLLRFHLSDNLKCLRFVYVCVWMLEWNFWLLIFVINGLSDFMIWSKIQWWYSFNTSSFTIVLLTNRYVESNWVVFWLNFK